VEIVVARGIRVFVEIHTVSYTVPWYSCTRVQQYRYSWAVLQRLYGTEGFPRCLLVAVVFFQSVAASQLLGSYGRKLVTVYTVPTPIYE
jgi:hypothetical protein